LLLGHTITFMENDELKDAYMFALDLGLTQESIAKHSKVSVESLRKFKQGESLGPANRKKLADWFAKGGMMFGNDRSDPAHVIAKELRNLADVLESRIDIETKRKRLTSLLDAYGSGRALGTAEEKTEGKS